MKATRAEIAGAKTLGALQELEKKHGYAYGWAHHIYNSRKKS